MDEINKILKNYNLTIKPDTYNYQNAIGIGDILFSFLLIQENILPKPYVFNTCYFTHTNNFSQPINALIFRLELITLLLNNHNTLSINDIVCIYAPKKEIPSGELLLKLTHFKFNFKDNLFMEKYKPKTNIEQPYIIFHTKLRLLATSNYNQIKKKISDFCRKYKCKYNIIIMGEQIFPKTIESCHGITTIFDELKLLKNNNNIIDLTKKEIYNSLNFENYMNDVYLIQNAKLNICFGLGGQLCTSMIFGNSTLYHCSLNNKNYDDLFFDNDSLIKNNILFFNNIDNMINHIELI